MIPRDRERILRTRRLMAKLQAKIEGERKLGFEQAARNAERMRKLLELELASYSEREFSELVASPEDFGQRIVDFGTDLPPRPHGWVWRLAEGVNSLFGTRHLVAPQANTVWFAGYRWNTALAKHALISWTRAALHAADEACPDRSAPGAVELYKAAFYEGFAQRMRERVELKLQSVRAKNDLAPSAATALMRIDQLVVRADAYIKAQTTVPYPSVGPLDPGAFSRGRAAADAVSLDVHAFPERGGAPQLELERKNSC